MSFADIGDDGARQPPIARGLASSRAERRTTDALVHFQEDCKALALSVRLLHAKGGSEEASDGLRQGIHQQMSRATASAQTAKDALEAFFAEAGEGGSGAEKRKMNLMYKKLHKDFKAQCEFFEKTAKEAEMKVKALPMSRAPGSGGAGSSRREATEAEEEQLLQDQIAFNRDTVTEREREVESLHKKVVQVNSMFRDLAVLVDEQGEDIDALESNFDQTTNNTDAALSELLKSSLNRRKINPIALWLLVVLALAAVVIVIIRLRH